jgi:phosphoglycolate phosphatase-like HAD superfamily hydrolase
MAVPRIACVVFDFDGVLVDSNAIKRNAYFDALAGIPGAAAVIAEVLDGPPTEPADRYHTIARIVERLRERAQLPVDDLPRLTEAAAARYTDYCERAIRECDEIPGASRILARLSQTYPLYLNSATPEPILRAAVAARGWAAFFRDILGSPATKVSNLQRVARAEGIEPRQLLFVGDSEVDHRAAAQYGCAFVAVVIDPGRFDTRVERVIEDLAELPSML